MSSFQASTLPQGDTDVISRRHKDDLNEKWALSQRDTTDVLRRHNQCLSETQVVPEEDTLLAL